MLFPADYKDVAPPAYITPLIAAVRTTVFMGIATARVAVRHSKDRVQRGAGPVLSDRRPADTDGVTLPDPAREAGRKLYEGLNEPRIIVCMGLVCFPWKTNRQTARTEEKL